jgi:hypothetical protein
MSPLDFNWIFSILTSLQPLVQKRLLASSRRRDLFPQPRGREPWVEYVPNHAGSGESGQRD